MGFNLVNLAITIRAVNASRLMNCLPLLGNEYAAVCRGLACRWPNRICETCSAHEACDWFLVFGQKLTSDPAALKRHQKPPVPFVFSFPVPENPTESIREIECGLVVIGPAISRLGMLLDGFSELLAGGLDNNPAEIVQIACRDYQGSVQACSARLSRVRSGTLVPENLVITSTEGLLESRTWINSDLQIRLLSPLRLSVDGRVLSHFEFKRFACSIMRRVSALAYYYGENEFECDFKEISQQAAAVVCRDDHFGYLEHRNKRISGVAGYGSFSGDFSLLTPFLVIGSYVHAGKGSSFGMGAYELLSVE